MKPVEINFAEYDRTMKRGEGGRSLLLKAVGLTKTTGLSILDATAGLMRDAFFLAKFGGKVTAIERSPVLAEMIEQALKSYSVDFTFLQGNAITLIPTLAPFDVIYLDPMFREGKSAKAKKDLQFLQALHEEESDDSAELFAIALKYAGSRVVVKRGYSADFLGGQKPSFSYTGKSTRYDIYITNFRNTDTAFKERTVFGKL